MIISRSPFRVSLFGGGTDYPAWFRNNGGMVLSTTINKYSYLTVRKLPPVFNYKYRLRYFKNEETLTVESIEHPSIRECLKFLNITESLEVTHTGDLPARSGLGSSSSFTVGMLHALHALNGKMPTKRELANQALEVEQDWLKEAVGSQDQIAASFGGLNKIIFGKDGGFDVEHIILPRARLSQLNSNLMLCFTGLSRTAAEFAEKQVERVDANHKKLNALTELAGQALNCLLDENQNLDGLGVLLDSQWSIKKGLTSEITNSTIDTIYATAKRAGAVGGKLLGAGGGGFLLLYVPTERQSAVRESLSRQTFVPFKFERSGSQIIYHTNE